ncbi:NAD-dependent epimerase/dehydratase family protein [Streptosporangium longisporum]|uniref:NAD-dependent epimerase/dehydratase family protein n=1 Tax=Streptosporangium longisporum TaxID=46187 RepID=UPI0031E7CF53
MRALVLGGYGAVGARIVDGLRAGGDVALAAGRDAARADVRVDLTVPASVRAALTGIDVVVNAAGAEDPALAALVTEHGAAFVDVTATTAYVTALERLAPPRPVLLSVGLAPGLTNLLAAAVHDPAAPAPIDVVLMLGAGEHHGEASYAWAYGLLGRDFRDPWTGTAVRNYTRGLRLDLPGYGRRRVYRADYSDQHVLTRDLGVPVRTRFGLDSRAATACLAMLTRLPGASRAPRGLRFPGTDRWLALARSGNGTTRWATGHGEVRATAAVAVSAARAATTLSPGVHHLHRVSALGDLPGDAGIRLGSSPRDLLPVP